MKRLLLTLALILSVLALSAQKYTVKEAENGNVVENGAAYYIYGPGTAWGEITLNFTVTANEDVNLIAECEIIQGVAGTYNSICLEQCYAPGVTITPVVAFAAGDEKEFSMHYSAEDPTNIASVAGQEQIMKYYLYEESNPDDRFVVNVTFKFSLDDAEELVKAETTCNAYPVPASDMVYFDYNLSSSANAEIAIYNMMGQEVMRNSISGVSGKTNINVSDLTDGVYFYSLIVNGKTEKSSKLVIKK